MFNLWLFLFKVIGAAYAYLPSITFYIHKVVFFVKIGFGCCLPS